MTTMTFSPNTIYKDLMKRVHPDLHPDMPSATAKAQAVNAAKGNIQLLKTLAITWGFLQGQANTNFNNNTRANSYTNAQARARNDFNAFRRAANETIINTLNNMGLNPHWDYSDRDINIVVKIHGRISLHKLIRTTKKCVVVDFYGIDKTVRMSNVVRKA